MLAQSNTTLNIQALKFLLGKVVMSNFTFETFIEKILKHYFPDIIEAGSANV